MVGEGLSCRDGVREIHVETGVPDGGHGRYFINLVSSWEGNGGYIFEIKVTISGFSLREEEKKSANILRLVRYRKGTKLVNKIVIIVP